MKKALKTTGRILLILSILLLLFTLVTFIVHRVKTKQETELLNEAGYYNPVSVGDYSLNVHDFGNQNGRHTFVGLSGRVVSTAQIERTTNSAVRQAK